MPKLQIVSGNIESGLLRALSAVLSIVCLLVLSSASLSAQQQHWVGTWAAAPVGLSPKVGETFAFGEQELTIREIVHISQGGKSMRVALSNEFGSEPLTISSAHVALHGTKDAILLKNDRPLHFSGGLSVTIPKGSFIVSDPVRMKLKSFSDVVISLCIPQQPLENATGHALSRATSFIGAGNQTIGQFISGAVKVDHWFFIKNVQVSAKNDSAAIVTLGDSITDGYGSTVDANRRWPDILAARLATDRKTRHLSVLNEGISGNRVLKEGRGPSALDRLDRDVLDAPGVKYIIFLDAINDIGRTVKPQQPDDPVTVDQIIDGYKEIVRSAHSRGLKIFGATLTPVDNLSQEGEKMRQALNAFIRTPGNFDGVIDFNKVLEDPQNPGHFLTGYNDGDHVHPNDAGYAVMANSVDLAFFSAR